MAHVFHYCINNKTYFQDTDKNILIKYLLTLDDYKQCDVKDLEESLDVVFKLYEDTMNREVPHSQFVEALKIYLNDLIYTDRYKYNLFTFISFKSHLDYILTPSYLGNDEKMTSLYIMMSDKLFYFNILYDVTEILYNNPKFWMFATTEKVIAALLKKDNVFSNIYKIMASNKDEDKKIEFTKEVNRIIDMLGSFDVKSITRPEIYNYMTEQALFNTEYQENKIKFLSKLMPNQSEDNLSLLLSNFDIWLNREPEVLRCDMDEMLIGAQLMKLAVEKNLKLQYTNIDSLVDKLREEPEFQGSRQCTDVELRDLIAKPLAMFSIESYDEYVIYKNTLASMVELSHDLYKTFSFIDSYVKLYDVIKKIFLKLSTRDLYAVSKNIVSKLPDMANLVIYSYKESYSIYSKSNPFLDAISPIIYYKLNELGNYNQDIVIFSEEKINTSKLILNPYMALSFVMLSKSLPQYMKSIIYDYDSRVLEIEQINLSEWVSWEYYKFTEKEKKQALCVLCMLMCHLYINKVFINFNDLYNSVILTQKPTTHTFNICGTTYTVKTEFDMKFLPFSSGAVIEGLLCSINSNDTDFFEKEYKSFFLEENLYKNLKILLEKFVKDESIGIKTQFSECKDTLSITEEIEKFNKNNNEISLLNSLITEGSKNAIFSKHCTSNMNFNFYKNLITIYLLTGAKYTDNVYYNLVSSFYYRLNTTFSGILYYKNKNIDTLLYNICSYITGNKKVLKNILTMNMEKSDVIMSRKPSKIYEPPASFQQIYLTNFDESLINMLSSILKKSLPRKLSYESINEKITTYMNIYENDILFYKDLKRYYDRFYEPNPREDVDFIRARSKYEKCKVVLQQYSKKSPVVKYLDYGGSTGAITSYFAKELRLNKENAYSLDIEQWQGNIIKKDYTNIKYITIKPTDSINLDADSFDLITCFQVLHHVEESELSRTVKDLHRLLKKGGLFIIREHDCDSDLTRLLIDIEHTVYECVANGKEKMNGEYLCTYNDGDKYKSINNWISYLESFGFKMVKEDDFEADYLKKKLQDSYGISGETRYTYRFFKKN